MTAVIVIVLLVLLAVGGYLAALAVSSRRAYAKANEVVPGQRTKAPAEWAGAHTAEARLHRRLRDAVAALHRDPRDPDMATLEARTTIEAEAVAIDERLIAAAGLPARLRTARIAEIEPAVAAVEDAVAAVADALASSGSEERLGQAVREVESRRRFLDEARAELDALDSQPSAAEIVDQIESQTPEPVRDEPPDDDRPQAAPG